MSNVVPFPRTRPALRQLPLAPYGKTARALNGALWVRTGPHAFDQAARDNARPGYGDWVVWPDGKDPRGYRWPVADLEVWLLDTSTDPLTPARAERLCGFAFHMLKNAAKRVVVVTMDRSGKLATHEYDRPAEPEQVTRLPA